MCVCVVVLGKLRARGFFKGINWTSTNVYRSALMDVYRTVIDCREHRGNVARKRVTLGTQQPRLALGSGQHNSS